MASLLGDMDNIPALPVKSRKRKPEPQADYEPPLRLPPRAPTRSGGYGYRNGGDGDMSSDGVVDAGLPSGPSSDDDFPNSFLSPKKKMKTDMGAVAPATERLSKFHVNSSGDEADDKLTSDADQSFDDLDMDAFMDVDDTFDEKPIKPIKEVKKEQKDVKPNLLKPFHSSSKEEDKKKSFDSAPSWLSVYDSLTVNSDDSFGPIAGSSSRAAAASNASILEEDGSFRFFWLDYLEHEGRLYFIGKTQDKTTKAWHSCCVTVENLQRNLFVLAREHRMEEDEETEELYETDVVPTTQDVYGDFDRIRKKLNVKTWRAKFVKRKYAFGEADVPRGESQWMKVVYGFDGERAV